MRFSQSLIAGIAIAAMTTSGPVFAKAAKSPLTAQLHRFAAVDAIKLGDKETEVPAPKWTQAVRDGLPGKGLAQHSMLVVGEGYNKMFVVNNGKVVWTYSTGVGQEYDDAWMLSNGNVLFIHQDYVAEVTPEKKEIWRVNAPAGTQIHTAQPIGLDKVMYVLNGLPPKLFIVNIQTGKTEVEHELPAISADDAKTVHGQFRRVRVTAQGTYLLALLEMGKVVELDKDFKEIWSYEVNSPWAAVRLKNGNTLITDERDITTKEVNPAGQTVWELKPTDLPEAYRFINTQSATRLTNGNTIICSRGGNGQGPQLVEVTPDKKVVWVLQDWKNLGPATAVQILDEPVLPEAPGESER